MEENESRSSQQAKIQENLEQALPRLTPEQVNEVSPRLVRERYAPGEVIIRQGDAPDRFFILLRGNAEVWHEGLSGESRPVDYRKPGEYFGEIGLLQDRPRSATVRAARDCEVELLTMDRAAFEELMEESRATEAEVAREMIQRLIQLSDFQE